MEIGVGCVGALGVGSACSVRAIASRNRSVVGGSYDVKAERFTVIDVDSHLHESFSAVRQ